MGSPERTIMNQIKTTLATITTGGGYNYELSGDDQVQIGGKFLPDRIPAAYIFAGETSSALNAGRTALNSYSRTQPVTIEMWIGSNSTDPAEQHLAPLDAQNDVMKILESDRTLNGNVDDLIINANRADEVPELPGVALVVFTVTLTYREVAGA